MITTYKVKCYKGYLGDFATEWWNEEDWRKHREYVEELKKDGTFGEEFEIELSIMHNPMFDTPQRDSNGIESRRLVILDFSNDNSD